MKKIMSVATLLGIVTLGLAGCVYVDAANETQTYDLTGFTGVNVSSAFEVVVTRADAYSITVTAPKIEQVQVEKQGATLRVWREGSLRLTPFQAAPKVEISLPQLTSVELSGASRGKVTGFETPDLNINVSGASHLEVDDITTSALKVKVSGASRLEGAIKGSGDADLEINGASTVELTGYARNIDINASGASRASLRDYYAKDGDVVLSGASRGTVNLTGKLNASISGASDLSYRGNPAMGSIESSGASSLHKA